MEAPGHEFVEKHLGEFIKEIFELYAKEYKYSGCKSVLGSFYNRTGKDEINRAMYMGNWLSDYSQIFATDLYFDLQYNMEDNIDALYKKVSSAQSDILNKPIIRSSKKLKDIVRKYTDGPVAFAKELSKLEFPKPNKGDYEFDTRDQWWMTCASLIKLLGYRKFCMAKENKVSESAYLLIMDNFLDEKKDGRLQFKLNQYYPSDHLDRPFDATWLDKPYMAEKKRNCYDARVEKYGVHSHDFLYDYLTILGDKLNHLNASFFAPVCLWGSQTMSHDQQMVHWAQLGHSLHGVEDFFAHSNYLELIVYHLDELKGQMDNSGKYFSEKEFINDILREKNEYEYNRYTKALHKPIRSDYHEKVKVKQDKLTTGIYAEGDTFTSLYHILFGHIDESFDDIVENKNYLDDPLYIIIQYFYESIGNYIELFDTEQLEEKYKIATGKNKVFNIEIVKFILNKNSDDEEVIKNQPEFIRNIDNSLLEYFIDFLNNLYQTLAVINGVTLAPRMVLGFIQIILMVIFMPVILAAMYQNLLEIAAFRSVAWALKGSIHKQFEKFANKIESHDLNLNDPMMYGTHSIIAKDEKYKNENWNYQAQRMALFMDKFILLNMFVRSDSEAGDQTDFVSLLHDFLHHPAPEKKKSSDEQKKQSEEYGLIGVMHIIDEGTNNPVGITAYNAFYRGSFGLIKSVSLLEYKERFLELNGQFILEEYLDSSSKVTLSDIMELNSEFKKILLPYQKINLDLHYRMGVELNKAPVALKGVKITAPINPNKMWMMQFFNKQYYEMFEEENGWLAGVKKWLGLGKKVKDIDLTEFEKKSMYFGDDEDSVIDLENIGKIKLEDVPNVFKTENDVKTYYAAFIKKYVNQHY